MTAQPSAVVTAEEIVADAISDRALVFGSLPGQGRDLDLLVRPAEERAISAALARAGFEERWGTWVRFAACSVEVVDLVPAADWHLPASELDALFAEAVPLDDGDGTVGERVAVEAGVAVDGGGTVEGGGALEAGGTLVRPAPHHALLILARRVANGEGTLDDKRRERLDEALREVPHAWEGARQRAPDWGAELALEQLRHVYGSGEPASRTARARAVAQQAARAGRSPARALARRWRSRILGRPRRAVIALSGLDGAGKSSQAQALGHTLERLGYDTATAWTRITYDGWIWRLAWPVKHALTGPVSLAIRAAAGRRVRGGEGPAGRVPTPDLDRGPIAGEPVSRHPTGALDAAGAVDRVDPAIQSPDADPVKRLREGSRVLTEVWTAIIALANGLSQRRLTRPELKRGRIVVCDRYTLDSVVALRSLYGEDHRFAWQRRVIELLSPRPVRAYLLDVSAETAFARKGEEDLAFLSRQADLYREEYQALGVVRVDGELPREELCAEIARDVWCALG